jgi:hypothetical protein
MSPSPSAPLALTPKQLLEHAYAVLDEPPAALAGRWPRAVALLGRQALEGSLDQLWQARNVKIGWATERAQLLCLATVLGDRRLAADAALAWSGLSGACHQHPYDLGATAGELAAWLGTVDELRRAVAKSTEGATT